MSKTRDKVIEHELGVVWRCSCMALLKRFEVEAEFPQVTSIAGERTNIFLVSSIEVNLK